MKNQALFFFIIFFFCGSVVFSQRITNEMFSIKLNSLPQQPLPMEYTTYSTSVKQLRGDMTRAGYTATYLTDKHFNLNAFNKIAVGGHFHIHVEIGSFEIESNENKTIKSTHKNDKGEQVFSNAYHKRLKYKMPILLKLVDYQGKIVLEQLNTNIPKEKFYTFRNGEGKGAVDFKTMKVLDSAWASKSEAVKNKLRKKIIEDTFELFGKSIKSKIDTKPIKIYGKWKVPKGKNVDAADEFAAKAIKAKEIFSLITAEEDLTKSRQEMEPILTFWETQKNKYSPDNKRESKIYFACARNLAVANLYLENIDAAIQWVEVCKAVGRKEGDIVELEKTISVIKDLMTLNNRESRHFIIEKGAIEGPESADYSVYTTPPAVTQPIAYTPPVKEVAGYVLTQMGDSIEGHFIFVGNDAHLRPAFNKAGNVTFRFVDKNNREVDRLLSPNWFRKIVFNGRTFKSVSYRDGLSVRKNSHILEVLTEGGNINLYREFSSSSEAEKPSYGGSLVIQQPDEDYNVLNFTSVKFADWKRSFAKFFITCEVLYAEIRVGEYSRSHEDIKRAVRVFNRNDCE